VACRGKLNKLFTSNCTVSLLVVFRTVSYVNAEGGRGFKSNAVRLPRSKATGMAFSGVTFLWMSILRILVRLRCNI
jgi:hypothetical protein